MMMMSTVVVTAKTKAESSDMTSAEDEPNMNDNHRRRPGFQFLMGLKYLKTLLYHVFDEEILDSNYFFTGLAQIGRWFVENLRAIFTNLDSNDDPHAARSSEESASQVPHLRH